MHRTNKSRKELDLIRDIVTFTTLLPFKSFKTQKAIKDY